MRYVGEIQQQQRFQCEHIEVAQPLVRETQYTLATISVNQDQLSNDVAPQYLGARQASRSPFCPPSNPPSIGATPRSENSNEFYPQSQAACLSQQDQSDHNSMTELTTGFAADSLLAQAQSDQIRSSLPQQSLPQLTQSFTSSLERTHSSPFLVENRSIPPTPSSWISRPQTSFDFSLSNPLYVPTEPPVSPSLNSAPYVVLSNENKHDSQLSSHYKDPIPDDLGISAMHPTHDDTFRANQLYNQSLLHMAIQEGHKEILRLLLRRGGIAINCRDSLGMTPLQLAVRNGQTELVQILLDHDADMNAALPTSSHSIPNRNRILDHDS